MKKSLSILLLISTVVSLVQANDTTGHTTYIIRPEFQSGRPERVANFRWDRAKQDECGSCGSLQVVPFGGQSTRPKELNTWFTFCGKEELVVGTGTESFGVDPNLNPEVRDVVATHFNISNFSDSQTPFKSVISFKPRHSFVGAGFQWRQYLGSCPCPDLNLWFEASTAVINVRNTMGLREKVINPTTTFNASVTNGCMEEAFCGEKPFFRSTDDTSEDGVITGQGWNYGKIKGKMQKTKLSDVELKLGYNWFCDESAYLEGYLGVVVPVGNKPTAEFVFEPLVGHHHFGIMWGKAFGGEIYCYDDTRVWWEMEYNGRYLFSNSHYRSFDLKNKPWSRYMLVYQSAQDVSLQRASEGINVFTQEMKVRPRFAHTFNGAFVMKHCGFQTEIGYNFWFRQSEKVRLKNPWLTGVTLSGLDATSYDVLGSFNRAATIGEPFAGANNPTSTPAQYERFTIKEEDLNLNSAAHPCALSHTLYASMARNFDGCKHPTTVGLGAAYEFSGVNTALSRWTVWAKLGVSL